MRWPIFYSLFFFLPLSPARVIPKPTYSQSILHNIKRFSRLRFETNLPRTLVQGEFLDRIDQDGKKLLHDFTQLGYPVEQGVKGLGKRQLLSAIG